MFQMAPEDRLRYVVRNQEEQRRQAALERMARAAPAEEPAEASGARSAKSLGWDNPWLAARQLLRSLTGTQRVASRHAAR
jgi:hypothetical protein